MSGETVHGPAYPRVCLVLILASISICGAVPSFYAFELSEHPESEYDTYWPTNAQSSIGSVSLYGNFRFEGRSSGSVAAMVADMNPDLV